MAPSWLHLRASRIAWSAVSALLLSGGVAYARDCGQTGRAVDAPPPSVLIIMDASKSMAKPAGNGRSRLAVAKAALRTLVDGLPAGTRVGLRLYGHRVAGETRAAGCRDTELVTPVGPLDRDALKADVGSYRAVGSTPIGRALRAGATDLPASGPASIVLVSDGGDNCAPPDPCEVAGELASRGTALSIQAVGFQVSGRARRQLRCIAERGRGVYRDAGDADELAVALRALAARAARTYRPVGTPIAGGSGSATAPAIGSGRFVDRIQADGERWYAVDLRAGQRLAAAAVVSHACPFGKGLADMIGTSLQVDVFDPSGELPIQRSGVANLFVGDESTESDGVLTPFVARRREDGFDAPGRYFVRVALSDNGIGTLAEVTGGDALALQVQTNIAGDAAAVALPKPVPDRAGARESTGTAGAGLTTVVSGGLLVGALFASFVLVLRRRRG